jgi:hypothetical protein
VRTRSCGSSSTGYAGTSSLTLRFVSLVPWRSFVRRWQRTGHGDGVGGRIGGMSSWTGLESRESMAALECAAPRKRATPAPQPD